jgi:selenide,water dikinase
MGGRPITALNLVGFPEAVLEVEVLGEILRGGAEKAREAGIDIVGGHTIKSEEPIYGLAVTGLVHPDRIVSNAGGRPGDRLVLTKPIGTGVITTAAKNDEDRLQAIGGAIAVMAALNAAAGEAMATVSAHAATDITGFGLLGHLRNVAVASGCSALIDRAAVPVLEAARIYAHEGIAPGGTHANWRYLADWVDWPTDLPKAEQLLLCDAQTSGGLLVAVPPEDVERFLDALRERGVAQAACVGELREGPAGRIEVR